jgi:hypothetical protein
MAASKHKGIAIINAAIVTHKELTIKGKKPNLPSDGDQSEDVIKLINELSFSNPVDFKIKPVAIAKGSIKKKLKHAIIHLDDILSDNRRERIIGGGFIDSDFYRAKLP